MNNEDVEKFYAYGFALYSGGHIQEASDVFRVLCTNRPLEFRFWFGLGASLQQGKSYKESLHAWAVAALIEKENPWPHLHAAESYFSMNEPIEAAKALKEVETRVKDNEPLKQKIVLLKEQWNMQ